MQRESSGEAPGRGRAALRSGRASRMALTARLGTQPAWLLPGLSPSIPAPASIPLQPAARLPALSSSGPTAGFTWEGDAAGQDREHYRGAHPNKVSIYEINASTWMNAEKPLCIPEDALAFLKPAGTASLCKPTCSIPTCLLQQGSSSPHLPLQTSLTFPLCVRTAIGADRLCGLGQDRYHRDLPTPGPADAELNRVAAGRAQMPGRSW